MKISVQDLTKDLKAANLDLIVGGTWNPCWGKRKKRKSSKSSSSSSSSSRSSRCKSS